MGNPPDRLKMLTAGTVDRSTRQTIIATLDGAAPGGNQAPGTRASRAPRPGPPPMPERYRPVDRSASGIAELRPDQGKRRRLAGPRVRC